MVSRVPEASVWDARLSAADWWFAASAARKSILALAICAASVEAHLRWGFEYRGPGMHQVSLLATVAMFAAACAGLFVASGSAAAWVLRRKSAWRHWAADAVLFCGWCALAVWVAVTAEIVSPLTTAAAGQEESEMSGKAPVLKGVVRDGVVVFEVPTKLPDGTEVEVTVAPLPFTLEEEAEFAGWRALGDEAWAMIDQWEKEEDDRATG